VTVCGLGAERVTGKLHTVEPVLPSTTYTPSVARVGKSSLTMLPCAWGSASTALAGAESVMLKVSSSSMAESPLTSTPIVAEVLPGANESTPDAAV
jgi:hypothetical protein